MQIKHPQSPTLPPRVVVKIGERFGVSVSVASLIAELASFRPAVEAAMPPALTLDSRAA